MAAQRILMDLAAQENALLIGMAREQFGKVGFRPDVSLAGMADEGVKSVAAAEKILLDLAAGETALVTEGMKEGLRLPPSAAVVADVMRHRVDTLVGMQKHMLDAAAEQTHAVAESYKEGEGLKAGARVAELARRGMEGFVESEKKFLDLAAQEITAMTKGGKRSVKAPRERMKVLTQMAREGAEKYMHAQKKLLDLAIEELEKVGKAKGERKEARKETRKETRPPWAELTEKSVKNLVAAEKSLLDLTIKPPKTAGKEEGQKAARPRVHGRRVHVEGHKTAGPKVAVAVPA
jgi:hypothetical protein